MCQIDERELSTVYLRVLVQNIAVRKCLSAKGLTVLVKNQGRQYRVLE